MVRFPHPAWKLYLMALHFSILEITVASILRILEFHTRNQKLNLNQQFQEHATPPVSFSVLAHDRGQHLLWPSLSQLQEGVELLSNEFSLAGMRETILHFSVVDNFRKMQVVEALLLSGNQTFWRHNFLIFIKLIFLADIFLTIKNTVVNEYEPYNSHCLVYTLPFKVYGYWQKGIEAPGGKGHLSGNVLYQLEKK